jgi:LacI family transcriptional regulator
MSDVARAANVSQPSVSLVLNGVVGARISDATRQRVLNAARGIGYELPGTRRQATSTRERNVIACLIDEISTSPHPVVSLDGVRDAAGEAGFLLAIYVTRSNTELEAATIETIRRDPTILGVIYATTFIRQVAPPPALDGLAIVLLNCHGDAKRFNSIVPGEVAGGLAATRYLISRGHRRIGFINGEPWMDAAADRLKGYRKALADAGIAFRKELFRNGDWLPLSGYQLALELLRLPRPPSAIFCANDRMAAGALEAARELGRRVPEDVSIMGYDDHEVSRYTHPPLSTLVLPNYEMGRRAVEVLIETVEDGRCVGPKTIKIDGPIVERASVGRFRR